MRICFRASEEWISHRTQKPGGDTYGYFTGAYYCYKALMKAGIEVVDDAVVVFHYMSPHFFKADEGRFNIVYTMWEAEVAPSDCVERLRSADMLIVPHRSSKEAFRRAGLCVPIYIARQGIDTDFFIRIERGSVYRPTVFQVLWVGAPNIRKAYDLAVLIYQKAFEGVPAASHRLYLKLTFYGQEGKVSFLPEFNAVVDSRNVDSQVMLNIYYQSSVLLHPARGEGVGLPPLEAMATGLPVLAISWGAMKDYMLSRHSYPLSYRLIPAVYGTMTRVPEVDIEEAAAVLRNVYQNYQEAVRKGVLASEFVRENFSLQVMGERLKSILLEVVPVLLEKKFGRQAVKEFLGGEHETAICSENKSSSEAGGGC